MKDALSKRHDALYLIQNAGNLKALPFLQVDERLKPLVMGLAANESLLAYLLEIAVEIVSGDAVNYFTEESEAHHKLLQLLRGFCSQEEDNNDDDQVGRMEDVPAMEEPGQVSGAEDLIYLFLVMACMVSDRLHVHKATLMEISSQNLKLPANHISEVNYCKCVSEEGKKNMPPPDVHGTSLSPDNHSPDSDLEFQP